LHIAQTLGFSASEIQRGAQAPARSASGASAD
jgi:hypothetical protein